MTAVKLDGTNKAKSLWTETYDTIISARKTQWTQAACTATVANQHGEFAAYNDGVEQRRLENGKWNVFTFHYYNYYYYNRTQHSKPLW